MNFKETFHIYHNNNNFNLITIQTDNNAV